jgi:hypothetical protein
MGDPLSFKQYLMECIDWFSERGRIYLPNQHFCPHKQKFIDKPFNKGKEEFEGNRSEQVKKMLDYMEAR